MENLYTSKTFLKMTDGRMHILPPGSAPGHKLQKPSKESSIFHSLGTLILFFFTKKQSQKGGMTQYSSPPKHTPGLKHA